MSKNKIGDAAEKQAEKQVERAVFTTPQPKGDKKERGSNVTPKSVMKTRRDGPDGFVNHQVWLKQFKSYSKKLDREAYNQRSELK